MVGDIIADSRATSPGIRTRPAPPASPTASLSTGVSSRRESSGSRFIKTNLVTHSNNFEQRFMQLSFTASASGVRAVAPSNPFLATPGNYLVL